MERIEFANVKEQIADMVDRAEDGESIEIVRNGKTAARVMPPVSTKVRVDGGMLDELHRKLPSQTESAGALIRRMRDDGY